MLAGRGAGCTSSSWCQGHRDVLVGRGAGSSRFLHGVKGVGDVLAGVEQGIHVFFAGVKDVGDVLSGRGSGC